MSSIPVVLLRKLAISEKFRDSKISPKMTVTANNVDKQKTAPVIHERPKMPRATWEALRHHIIKQRKRKLDEEGKAEEHERLKRERENKKKQEKNSLE